MGQFWLDCPVTASHPSGARPPASSTPALEADYQGAARHTPGSSPATHVRDARLALLNDLIPGLFTAKACLDIGCNAGFVSCQLAFDFDAASVTGVDIDPYLVRQAELLLRRRSSRVHPTTQESRLAVDYFPISAVVQHGCRPNPTFAPASSKPAPVSFVSADYVVSASPDTAGPHDVILALSVTKWLHLEHGDQGLVNFFAKCSSSLVPGGLFVLEPQPWSSYEKAVKKAKAPHFQPRLKTLNLRPETCFTDLLERQGLTLVATSEALPRRIIVYRKE
ncbi:Bin3-domain-containing protein [Polyplosphaeria fusca]|uniref:RNA methyltransferase n=1 Tax=Polyplosphaeria fusca TaxID=682080 RepID=A0A9P4UZ65_9PLEO|nr:Bin3-domain-containing protein [Polyplosphaeria fusca]